MNPNKSCYVYKFIDLHGKYMYVGETKNLSRRIGQHISLKSGKFTKKLLNQIQRIEYIKVKDKVEARQFEIYYINKYKPYLNKADKFNNIRFVENDFYERKWKTYKILKELSKTPPRVLRMALMIMYITFIFIIFMLLAYYF